jgi:hypothetical protein
LTAALRREGEPKQANPPAHRQLKLKKDFIMLDMNPMQTVARRALLPEALTRSVPAAFAETPDVNRTSRHYQFISTARVIKALLEAGFEPTRAQQTRVRAGGSLHHARHMIRFSYVKHSLSIIDAVPELILINSHDATSAYTLRAGLYRPVCTNGLVSPIGEFGLLHVPHRGNVIHNVVDGALKIASGFNNITRVVEHMAARTLSDRERRDFAAAALQVRYPNPDQHLPVGPDQLLSARRSADFGSSLWLTYNVVQQNLVAGGLHGRSATGRASRTRAIRAIREDIRVNVGLWNHAMTLLDH